MKLDERMGNGPPENPVNEHYQSSLVNFGVNMVNGAEPGILRGLLCAFRLILFFSLLCHRRKKAALQAWRPSEAMKSRRRRFFSALWVPRVWASASPAVQPRNLVSTSVTLNQAPFLQKSDLRWSIRSPVWRRAELLYILSHTHLLWTAYVLSQIAGWWPDCGGEWSRFHQCGPQRGEFSK